MKDERRLYFELAERLGMTVSELLARMSCEEISEWGVFLAVKGEEREAAEEEAARRQGG